MFVKIYQMPSLHVFIGSDQIWYFGFIIFVKIPRCLLFTLLSVLTNYLYIASLARLQCTVVGFRKLNNLFDYFTVIGMSSNPSMDVLVERAHPTLINSFFFTLPVKVVHKSLHCSIDFLTYFERALPTQVIALFATNITFVYLLSWVLLHDQFMWDSILLKEKSDGYMIKTLRISHFEGHVKLKMFPFFFILCVFHRIRKRKIAKYEAGFSIALTL